MELFWVVILVTIFSVLIKAISDAQNTQGDNATQDLNSQNTYQQNYDDDDDWITNPAYSYLPGNIYYHDDDWNNSSTHHNDDWDDYFTDPAYSFLPGNIYHDNHYISSSGDSWDSWDDWHHSSWDSWDDHRSSLDD